MRQKLITREKGKVTWTKYNLYTFRGFLHFDLPYVEIISPIGIGKKFSLALEQLYNILSKNYYLSLHQYVCSCCSKTRRWRKRWWCKCANPVQIQIRETPKKRKSSTSEKKKDHSSFEPSWKKAKGSVTEDKVRLFLSKKECLLYICQHPDINPSHFHSLVLHPKLSRWSKFLRPQRTRNVERKGTKKRKLQLSK